MIAHINENPQIPTLTKSGSARPPLDEYNIGDSKELNAEPNSGTVMIIPIAIESSEPLNHLETMALYAITKFSEHTPKTARPISMTVYIS